MAIESSSTTHRDSRSSLIAGGTIGILIVTIGVSFGSIIFSGELSESLAIGIGLLLFSSTTVAAIVATLSSQPAVVAGPQDTTVTVLVLVASHIVETLPAEASAEERVYTVIAMMVLNSLITGALFIALGRFKLGELSRFVPYPVVGGFLAGIGVLLIRGAFHSLSGIDPHHLDITSLFQTNILAQWLPGVLLALVLFFLLHRINHFWVIPSVLGTAIVLFYLVLALTGTSIEQANSYGWLLGNLPSGNLFHFMTPAAVTHANWAVIFKQLPDLAALWLVDSIMLLFTASGIELATSGEMDLNRELEVAGVASVASGLGGGVSGFHVLGETILAHHTGGDSRLVGWVIASLCLATLLGGGGLLPFLPKLIVIGVPILLGLHLIHDWLYQAWFKLSRADFAVIVVIVLTMVAVGYLQGVGVGLLAAIVLFVVDSSRISIIKHELSGAHHRSHVERSPQQQQLLYEKGDQILILELQGPIFFATANNLLKRIKHKLTASESPLNFLVLDFRQITGLDSSAALSFVRLKQTTAQHHFHLILTHLKPIHQKRLQRVGALDQADAVCQCLPDLDRGLEWCETQILEATQWRRSRFTPLPMILRNLFSEPKQVSSLMPYLEKLQMTSGEVLFQQDDSPSFLYFLESGQVSTFLRTSSGESLRLRTLKPGTVLGEIAFYTQAPYGDTAIADQPSTLYRLSINSLKSMIQETPQTAAVFQEFMLAQMARHLAQANFEIKNLFS